MTLTQSRDILKDHRLRVKHKGSTLLDVTCRSQKECERTAIDVAITILSQCKDLSESQKIRVEGLVYEMLND